MADNEVVTIHPGGGVTKALGKQVDQLSRKFGELMQRMDDIENTAPIRQYQDHLLEQSRRKRVVKLLGGKESKAYADTAVRASAFRSIMIEYRRKFGVAAYQDTPKKEFDRAQHFYANWEPDFELYERIQSANE
ncbi:ORF6C domain-containing protein [Lacticaseibacillus hulanensis]|uniref:ORF6C domain-containing protein n=1 Tax=Lacticaseibacillus hulanensis TaxID=2493111 RepID=UPI000FDBB056|nr:ORF6C domain-containing protein [Lacticaseibacillus hulanensis]